MCFVFTYICAFCLTVEGQKRYYESWIAALGRHFLVIGFGVNPLHF